MKAYRATYLRVGTQESWAGWRIAGHSSQLPIDGRDEYFGLQSANSLTGTVTKYYEKAPKVWELQCSDKFIFYSKLTYGIMDQGVGASSRASMRSDGIIISLLNEQDSISYLNSIINISDDSFNNDVEILKTYPLMIKNNENTESVSQEKIVTNYPMMDINLNMSSSKAAWDTYFNSEIYSKLFKCLLWVLTDKSAVTLSLIFNGSDEEKKDIITYILKSLPYTLLRNFSFRTIKLDGAQPVKIDFVNSITECEKYFDISTGANNIIDEYKLDLRWEKYDFINHILKYKTREPIETYLRSLDNKMKELGDPYSTDLNFIKAAHEIVVEGDIYSLDNLSVLKKFQNFLTLPYNNERIDLYIADLLKVIVSRDMMLNDSIKDRLQAKLKITNSVELKSCGYSYNAKLMISSNDRDKEFAYLYNLKNSEALYNEYLGKINCEVGGDEFLDEFYGDYVSSKEVTNMVSLVNFFQNTRNLKKHNIIDRFVYAKAELIGKKLIDDYFLGLLEFKENFRKYSECLSRLFPGRIQSVHNIIEKMKLYFWYKFDFNTFKYDNRMDYEYISYRTNRKSIVVNDLVRSLDVIIIKNNMSAKSLKSFFEKSSSMLSDADKKAIINEIQRVCVERCSKKHHLDFWLEIAELSNTSMADFIVENDIKVITDVDYLQEEFENAKYFQSDAKTDRFLRHLSKYAEQSDDKKIVVEIINNIKKLDKMQKKNEKSELKYAAKIEKQKLKEYEERLYSKTKQKKMDEDYVIGYDDNEKGKHYKEDKKRGFPFFKKK